MLSLHPRLRSGFRHQLLTELESLHLSRRSVRQFRNEVITTRLFEPWQRRFAKRAYVSFRRFWIVTVSEHEKRTNARQSILIKPFDDGSHAHGVMSQQDAFD